MCSYPTITQLDLVTDLLTALTRRGVAVSDNAVRAVVEAAEHILASLPKEAA